MKAQYIEFLKLPDKVRLKVGLNFSYSDGVMLPFLYLAFVA